MPYQPSQVDISGQIRGRAIAASGQNIAEGFGSGFEAYQQNKLRNQILQGENEGLLKAFLADPQTKQYAPDGIDKFLTKAEKGGGMSLGDNVQLNGMLNAALKTRGVIEGQKQQAAQADLQRQQAAEFAQRIAMQKQADIDDAQSRAQLMKAAQPIGAPYQPAAIDPATFQRPMAPQSSANPGMFLGNATSSINAPLPDVTPFQSPIVAPQQTPQRNPTSTEIRLAMARSGQPMSASAIKMLDAMGTEEERLAAAKERAAQPGLEVVTIRQAGPKGEPIEVTYNKRTGQEIARGPMNQPPRAYPTAAEAGDMKLAETLGTEMGKSSGSLLNEVSDAAGGAPETLARIDSAEKLFQKGESSGWGQGTINNITGALAQMGWYPKDKQASKEELQMALAIEPLKLARELYKGQGSVSDRERVRIDAVAANIGKTPQANLAALAMSKALATRAIELEKVRRNLYDQGKSSVDIAEQLRRWTVDHPLTSVIAKEQAKEAPKLPSGWSVK